MWQCPQDDFYHSIVEEGSCTSLGADEGVETASKILSPWKYASTTCLACITVGSSIVTPRYTDEGLSIQAKGHHLVRGKPLRH